MVVSGLFRALAALSSVNNSRSHWMWGYNGTGMRGGVVGWGTELQARTSILTVPTYGPVSDSASNIDKYERLLPVG
jgi:hypothetical protein